MTASNEFELPPIKQKTPTTSQLPPSLQPPPPPSQKKVITARPEQVQEVMSHLTNL